ncbi:hypothetical protein [Hymenobacter wooponensis]|uniref:DUF4292 domain-containing protein n=1 Tax=Hymenobacter wooponensis TaxID=1525360 RepID=A0A4Z0MKT1_9BACT|nr:hypothetical protein [Hymenobacter wooponensis]TGD79785.1 hypothetical protein EU557_16365 [Hymenobacter wooponensis]
MSVRRVWLSFGSLLVLGAACSRQPTADNPSRFVASPPTIDGRASEWTDSLQYTSASKLQYQVLNDARAVYVRLRVADPATQAKIILQGLTVWLDTTGRNQQQFGVHYPLGGGMGRMMAMPGTRPAAAPTPSDRQARLGQALASMTEMELLNYKGNREPTLTDAQSQLGVHVAAAFNPEGTLVYELMVPMRLLYRKLPNLASGQKAVVGLTLAGTKWTAPGGSSGGMNGGGMRGGGMRSGGMGGNSSGMRGGGGMRGGSGGRTGGGSQTGAPISLKTAVQLAKP